MEQRVVSSSSAWGENLGSSRRRRRPARPRRRLRQQHRRVGASTKRVPSSSSLIAGVSTYPAVVPASRAIDSPTADRDGAEQPGNVAPANDVAAVDDNGQDAVFRFNVTSDVRRSGRTAPMVFAAVTAVLAAGCASSTPSALSPNTSSTTGMTSPPVSSTLPSAPSPVVAVDGTGAKVVRLPRSVALPTIVHASYTGTGNFVVKSRTSSGLDTAR